MTVLRKVDLGTNDIGRDAWGRPKFVLDDSIFHGMFTYNIPVPIWYETINSVLQSSFVNATSVDGKLVLTSGGTLDDITELRTYRNPRYEPNRGHLYSTSVFLPNPSDAGNRRFGYFTHESGSFFSLESGSLYAIIRTTIQTVTIDDKYLIDTTGIDLSKGNLFDIQMQWRGVGDYKFFINLKLVKKVEYVGTRVELTMFNPANPLCYESENKGDEVVLYCGCVDVTSEGGEKNGKTYGSVGISTDSGEVSITGVNQPILAIRSKLLVNSLINTRDTLALLATAYADQRSVFKIWATRDFTAITEGTQTWSDFGDGHLEYIELDPGAGTPMVFDTAKADSIFTIRVPANAPTEASALFEGRTDIHQTPGDMFVFTMQRDSGIAENAGVTYEFAEEI